ncbi:MAG: cupin domain-containing protein [Chlorobia bacterium]|nr:cupin domain-containing protein [Fimbriimonadaceae bacterium]
MLKHEGGFKWDGVEVLPYKEDGTIFRSVTRQILFHGIDNLPVELRYFEVGIDGHSTLERHEHAHLVVINQGSGRVLVGDQVREVSLNDVVHVPPMTWHQFRATNGEPLGFLCVVSQERDRPQRPDPDQVADLNANPTIAEFIRT